MRTEASCLILILAFVFADDFSSVEYPRTREEIFDSHRCYLNDRDPGWPCSDGECIPFNQICDKITQCRFKTDETLGCVIFEELTPCFAHNGNFYEQLCQNNTRCFLKDTFDEERDCKTSIWPDCPGEKDSWRCISGECINSTQVCDNTQDCADNSDESEGCEMSEDCSRSMKKKCEDLETSNWCKKVNNDTETCMCGSSPECDSTSTTFTCVDSYDHAEPGGLDASVDLLPYLRSSCKPGPAYLHLLWLLLLIPLIIGALFIAQKYKKDICRKLPTENYTPTNRIYDEEMRELNGRVPDHENDSVMLTRGDNGEFGVRYRVTSPGFVVFDDSAEGSSAEKYGKIERGDRLLAINEQQIRGTDDKDSVDKMIKDAGPSINLTVRRFDRFPMQMGSASPYDEED